jgi:outer membrane protein
MEINEIIMKKIASIIIVFFLFAATGNGFAQVEKGKFLVGARSDFNAFFENTTDETTIDGNTTESDGPKSNRFNLTPSVGYFITDGFAGGLFMNLGINNSEEEYLLEDGNTETLRNNNTTFRMGPFLRYYLDMEKVRPFAHLQIGFGSNNQTYDQVEYDVSDPTDIKVVIVEHTRKYNLSAWGIGAGAAFFITNNISIDVMLGYNQNASRFKDEDTGNEYKRRTGGFGLDVGFSVVIP